MSASMSRGAKELYEFGPFRIDPDKETLLREGEPVPLTPKTFQVLLVLVRHSKEVVTKDELMKMVWPDTFVEEANLSRNIFMLRKALGETPQDRYILTVPGRGYRLAENVHIVPGEELTIVAASHSRVQVDVKETKSWRLVAAAAIALLATATGATWLAMHLREAPRRITALGEKDTVVLADFANSTGDPVFDETLRRGLAIQLEQSPVLNIVSDERVHQILGFMGRSEDGLLTPAIAYEVCQRAGSTAVLEGAIRPIGDQYILGLSAKNCRNGEILDEEQVQAARKEDVLNALSKMAANFRTRIGESFMTIEQHNTPLAEATTPSLEALKAFSMGWKIVSTTGSAASVPLYHRAVEIDPHFAMAYAMLGRVYGDVGESSLSAENTTKAWQLRDRTSSSERFFIEASYDVQVTGNLEKAQQTCEAWARTYPRDSRPYGFLSGMIYPVLGRFELAVEKSQKMVDYDPNFAYGYNILALSEMAIGNLDEAARILQKADDLKLTIPDIFVDRYQLAFLKNDQNGMARVVSGTPREAGAEDWIAHMQSTALAYSGHLRQATELSRRSIDLARHSDQSERAALFQSEEAIRDALFENKPAAVRHAESALALSRGRDVVYGAAFALGLSGNLPQAGVLADDLERRFPEDTAVEFIYVPELRALIALKQGKPAKAVELLQSTTPYEAGQPPSSFFGFYGMYYSAYLRGEAYLAEHQDSAAAAEFQKILDHRGVVISDPIGALAHLQQGRAFSLSGDKFKAKAAYREFLELWKDADPAIPAFERARVEYRNLD